MRVINYITKNKKEVQITDNSVQPERKKKNTFEDKKDQRKKHEMIKTGSQRKFLVLTDFQCWNRQGPLVKDLQGRLYDRATFHIKYYYILWASYKTCTEPIR